jgi:hypothetical protein
LLLSPYPRSCSDDSDDSDNEEVVQPRVDGYKSIWVDYLNALGVRLVLGVNDWADRNFIYSRDGKRLYSVDEDVLGKEIKPTIFVKSKYDKVKDALLKYHEDVHVDVILLVYLNQSQT